MTSQTVRQWFGGGRSPSDVSAKSGHFNPLLIEDFELHWGGAEKWNLEKKRNYFLSSRNSISKVLYLFNKYGIHVTWATVGFLFAKNKKQLLEFSPKLKPTYKNFNLSYYNLIDKIVGENENEDPFHFANSLIKLILSTPNQELGTHTFSHYYCKEKGQTVEQFDEDLKAAQKIAKENFGIILKSLVFPRNQFNRKYIKIAKKNGIRVVRSNPDVWFWSKQNKFSPLIRALDTLTSISKKLSFTLKKENIFEDTLLLPASRFLRPYVPREKIIQKIKFNRIKNEMTYAAKNKQIYHLWWHPHNFGNNVNENLFYLENILLHYKKLNRKYGFLSKSMGEVKVNSYEKVN